MKYELTNLKGLKRKIKIQVSSEEVQKAFDQNYKKAQKKATLPGYRKGKGPLSQVRSLYQEEVTKDTAIHLINEFYPQIMQERDLIPATQPEVEFKAPLKEGQAFSFFLTVEIMPEVDVDTNFTPSLSLAPIQVQSAEVNQVLENMRNVESQYQALEEKRAVQWGDSVKIEMRKVGTSKKKVLDIDMIKEAKDPVHALLVKTIIGLFPGEKRDLPVHLELPKESPITVKIKERSRTISLAVLNIQKKILPDMNDQFAQKIGYKDKAEMISFIQNSLKEQKQAELKEDMKKQALRQLTKSHPTELPEQAVAEQRQKYISYFVEQLKAQGIATADIQEHVQKAQKKMEEEARFVVHSNYLIADLIYKLNFKVSDREIQLYVQKMKEENPQNKVDYDWIKNFLLREKVLNHLVEKALKAG